MYKLMQFKVRSSISEVEGIFWAMSYADLAAAVVGFRGGSAAVAGFRGGSAEVSLAWNRLYDTSTIEPLLLDLGADDLTNSKPLP
mmetsp:Transcript_11900/g.19486  ORF Transcript_11900/g.19486 Transcript_11900/m.19486 type:complete len:85 (+) Transcript_11900:80-334(+)